MRKEKLYLTFFFLLLCIGLTLQLNSIFFNNYHNNDIRDTENYLPAINSVEVEWTRFWGDNTSQNQCNAIASDSAGNIYLGGITRIGPNYDMAIVKYDDTGIQLWNRTWGGSGEDFGRDVVVDSSDNVYFVGSTNSFGAGNDDIVLVKYDDTGIQLWNRTWGEISGEQGQAVAVDSSDYIYVGGIYDYAGGREMLLVKYDSSGVYQWNRTWGSSLHYVYSARGIVIDSSDNIYIAGDMDTSQDIFLVKYDISGNYQWNRTWGGSGLVHEYSMGAAVDSSDNIYISGMRREYNNEDFLLLKYDSSGSYNWNRTWGGSDEDYGYAVVVDSLDDIYQVGKMPGQAQILKYSSSGVLQWNYSSNTGWAFGILIDSINNIYIGGFKRHYMFLEKFSQSPDILINLPVQNEFIGSLAPDFNIDIIESNLDNTWYTLNDGEPIIFSGLTGSINQAEWDTLGPGVVTIKFYANNTYGKENYAEVTVFKDINNPGVLIINPNVDEKFGDKAPTYDINVTEPNLDSIWYTIDGGVNNYTITLLSGDINQGAWDAAAYGDIIIRFYAEDLAGNIDYSEINVKKIKTEPAIPGYQSLVLICVIGVITAIYIKKNLMKKSS